MSWRGQCGTRDELERAIEVARKKGLHVRPFKTCLMFTPPMNGTRCLFTLWAGREDGKLTAYVSTEAFLEFFPLDTRGRRAAPRGRGLAKLRRGGVRRPPPGY